MSYYRAENILPSRHITSLKDYVHTISSGFETANVIPYVPGFRVAEVVLFPSLPEGCNSIIGKHLELAAIALDVSYCFMSEI